MRPGDNPSAARIPYSRRLDWQVAPNALISLRRELAASRHSVLDLCETNPTACGLGDWSEAIATALCLPESARYQPAAEGLPSAREAVADFYADLGAAVDPEQILLTASTSESYSFLFQMLCDPGDEVLIPAPSYPLFEHLAGLAAVRLRPYRLHYLGEWLVDFRSLEEALTPRTRALVAVNPNNPTGSYLSGFEAERLLEICASRGMALIADEVFWEYAIPPAADRAWFAASESTALSFSLGGLSKSAGMPQMKVGWMVARGPETLREEALERLRWIVDTYLSVSAPVQHALPRLLEIGKEIREAASARISENAAAFLKLGAQAPHLSPLPAEGGWSAVLRLPSLRTDHAWCEALLRRQSLWVQPGYFYDFDAEAHVVLSLLTTPEIFGRGLERIAEETRGACA